MGRVLILTEEEKNAIEGIYDKFFEIKPEPVENSNLYKIPVDVLTDKHHKSRKSFFESLPQQDLDE